MKSYTQGRNLYGKWTKNTDSTALTTGDEMANDAYRKILGMRAWPFLKKFRTISTLASTQFYNLPYDIDLVQNLSVKISTITYTPQMSPSEDHWDRLNLITNTSDFPQWYIIRAGQVGLWPKPATAGNTIQITGKVRVIDMQFADYTTGTIVSIANGATTLTGSGVSFAAPFTGRYIAITGGNTANLGDGLYYEISSVTSSTVLELVRAYGGTTISAGSAAYSIGQFPVLPDDFHETIWKYAAAVYWGKELDAERAKFFQGQYDRDVAALVAGYSAPTSRMVIDDGKDREIINPNLTISL